MEKKTIHQVCFEALMNKMFEIAGHKDMTFEKTLTTPGYYSKYTMTVAQEKEFLQWGYKFLKRKLRYSKPLVMRELNWFNMSYGLAVPERQALLDKLEEDAEA